MTNVTPIRPQPIQEMLDELTERAAREEIRTAIVVTVNSDETFSAYRSGDFDKDVITTLGLLEKVKLSFYHDMIEHTAKAQV